MKKVHILSVVALLTLLVGTGCNDAEYSVLGTHAYLAEAESSLGTKVTVPAVGGVSTPLTIRVSNKVATDCSFRLVVDEAALENYNKVNGTGYVLLPADHYTLPDVITVKAGEYASDEVYANIQAFSKEMNDSGESYALPLQLQSVDNVVPTMGQSATYVIAAGSIIEFSAPVLNRNTPITVDFSSGGDIQMSQFTVEMRFQLSTFSENQAFFDAGSKDGSDDNKIYIRMEDPAGKWNLIQIVGKNNVYLNAVNPFETNKWQHFAISYTGSKYLIYVNGKLDAQKDAPSGNVTLQQISMISSGSYFGGNCLLNEVRLWDKALNESQIMNNQTGVSPKSQGLRAYWRMTEGSGNTFQDATGNGYTATAAGTVRWISGILSSDAATPWN